MGVDWLLLIRRMAVDRGFARDKLERAVGFARAAGLFHACETGTRVCATGFVRVRNAGRLHIGDRVTFSGGMLATQLVCRPGATIEIGDETTFNYGVSLDASDAIRLGRRCMVASMVRICDARAGQRLPVTIGDDVSDRARRDHRTRCLDRKRIGDLRRQRRTEGRAAGFAGNREPGAMYGTGGNVVIFSRAVLDLDAPAEAAAIEQSIRDHVRGRLRRRGAVVGLSGGVDSSVVATLCVRALGAERVLGLLMPERHSSDDSLRLGQLVADHLGLSPLVEDIAPALEAVGCYVRQAEAIRLVFPDYGDGWRCKLTLPSILESERLNVFKLTVQDPSGKTHENRMPPAAYLGLVAATNFKQRVRKMTEYYHADRLGYAVAGTPNRLEYDQGFFVKQGDGAADFKPIAHLYKTQVYQLAHYLGVPEEIRQRPPTTDTYSMEQTQDEFYFALPYDRMDLCLYAHNHAVPPAEVAPVVDLRPDQVERVYRDIESKRRTTRYLHTPPLLVRPVQEVGK